MYLRFVLDLAIPEDPNGTLVGGVKIPTPLANRIPAIRQAVRDLKQYAKKINEGQPNEEMTVKATFHICRHDEGNNTPCAPEQEV